MRLCAGTCGHGVFGGEVWQTGPMQPGLSASAAGSSRPAPMLARQRQEHILERVATTGGVRVADVVEELIMFVNWESINKKNSLFRVDNEQNWNLQTVVKNTKDEGRTIVLLIDESHKNAKTDKSQELIDIISPRLVIEITATPKASTGTLIDIPLQAVIREGMIKKEIQINNAKTRFN